MAMRRKPLDLSQLHRFPVVAVDAETTGLEWYRGDRAFGVALAAEAEGTLYSGYYDLRNRRTLDAVKKELWRCRLLVNHNIKFDMHMLANIGLPLPPDRVECTQVRAALIDEHEDSYALDSLGQKYVGMGKHTVIYEKLAQMFGGKPTRDHQMKNLHRAPEEMVAEYAVPDAEIALMLWMWQEEQISQQNLGKVWTLEKELLPVLFDIERNGVRVDGGRAKEEIQRIDPEMAKAQESLNKLAGREINANSPKQMRELFGCTQREDGAWCTSGGVVLVATEAGNPSLDAETLRLLTETHGDPRAKLVLSMRKMSKAKQFLRDHILGHMVDDKVYCNYNQTKSESGLGTGTGRFSINSPALQQIPKRDRDIAARVRSCFLPDKGEEWACADWDQFEFRWFAHYVNDPTLNELYEKNPDTDFHQMVADLTSLPRSARYAGDANAKQINLGLVFGMGQGTMAVEMGLPYIMEKRNGKEWAQPGPEAIEKFNQYHAAVPGVKDLLGRASSIARSRGFVMTAMERHIRFPKGMFVHKAGGLVFQGTSADCMKVKMIELHRLSKKTGDFRLLISVHDESDMSMPKGKEKLQQEIKRRLETFDGEECPIRCRIPIRSSLTVGPNWWEACK